MWDQQLWGSPSPSAEFKVVLVTRGGGGLEGLPDLDTLNSSVDTHVACLGVLSCLGVTSCACLCALMFALHTPCLWIIIEEGAQSIQAVALSRLLLLFFECLLSLSGASPTQSSRISSCVYSGLSVLFLLLLFVAVTCLMLL